MKRIVLTLLLLVLAASCSAATTACTANPLPKSVSEVIQKKWQGWQIVDVPELRPDDQSLWKKAHGNRCPGVAAGRFEGSGTSYAVTLFRRKKVLEQVLLVIKPTAGGEPVVYTLSPPQTVSYLSVVHKLPPGSYDDVEGGRIRVKSDAVVYEAIEVGSVTYYFDKGKFRSVQTSE